jgi:hypothetical protein
MLISRIDFIKSQSIPAPMMLPELTGAKTSPNHAFLFLSNDNRLILVDILIEKE